MIADIHVQIIVGNFGTVTPHTRCRLKLLKLERIKDFLLMEEELIRNQERQKPQEQKNEVSQVNCMCSCVFYWCDVHVCYACLPTCLLANLLACLLEPTTSVNFNWAHSNFYEVWRSIATCTSLQLSKKVWRATASCSVSVKKTRSKDNSNLLPVSVSYLN